MKYPEDFAGRVKSLFGDSGQVNRLLDSGSELLGRMLDDSSQGGLSFKEVVEAIDTGKLSELRARASRLIVLRELYADWLKLSRS